MIDGWLMVGHIDRACHWQILASRHDTYSNATEEEEEAGDWRRCGGLLVHDDSVAVK